MLLEDILTVIIIVHFDNISNYKSDILNWKIFISLWIQNYIYNVTFRVLLKQFYPEILVLYSMTMEIEKRKDLK